MLKAMADNMVEISTQCDAAMYDSFAGNSNYIFEGIGNELEVIHSTESLIVQLQTGGAVIQGRHVYETIVEGEGSTFTLEPNSTGYLVIRYDLSQPVGQEARFMSVPLLLDEELNNEGLICDLPLGYYTTDDVGVSSYTDLRNMQNLSKRVAAIEKGVTTKLSGFTIAASAAWEQVSAQSWDTEGTFLYRYAVAIEGVTADDQLRPVFDSKTLLSGVIAPVGETYEGGAYFYASEIPDWQVKCVELTKVRVY